MYALGVYFYSFVFSPHMCDKRPGDASDQIRGTSQQQFKDETLSYKAQ